MNKFNFILTFIFVSTSLNLGYPDFSKMTTYTQKEVLNDLDQAGVTDPYKFWFDLNDAYVNPSGSRMTLFADKERWAIVFEKSGYDAKGLNISLELTYFGNCLCNLEKAGSDNQFTCNSKWVILSEDTDLDKIGEYFIFPKAKEIKIRDTLLPIEHDIKKFKARNIEPDEDENGKRRIDIVALTRYLDEQNAELFRATEKELRKCIPADLPKLFVINKWYHNEYSFGQGMKPSENETFQLISNILVTKDTTLWKPKLEPNSDWRNYPDAGNL